MNINIYERLVDRVVYTVEDGVIVEQRSDNLCEEYAKMVPTPFGVMPKFIYEEFTVWKFEGG